jgi:hypothetical protein
MARARAPQVSQRYQFNIGQGTSVGGLETTGTSVYGSNGNSLPSPPPEFMQELRVNTSMYDAQQGATSGAQIDVNTASGTNTWHGQMFGTFADNVLNAAPFYFKQQYLLAQQGVGAFPLNLVNPQLHRWTTGATMGGPLLKDKLFLFLGYQHIYASDEATGVSQLNVPVGLSNDRTLDATGLPLAASTWANGAAYTGAYSQQALDLLQSTLPNGQYLIPSAQSTQPYAYGVPNVTLGGVSVLAGDKANGSLDYDLTKTDRMSFKYFYQNNPLTKPYGFSNIGGFPTTTANTSQVGALDNAISIGPRLNWEQRVGYSRMGTYTYYNQTAMDTANPSAGGSFGISGSAAPAGFIPGILPGLRIGEFGTKATAGSPTLYGGPESAFVDTGYHQNRINPSSNLIFTVGQHTIVAGGGYSYTQLNVDNNRTGHGEVYMSTFENFLAGTVSASGGYTNVLDSICGPPQCAATRNLADRYYRSNEADGYFQDKWQAMSNLSFTLGVRYDYHGGLTEKYGNLFNFDPNSYNVTGTDMTGFTVINSGLVVAPNNPNLSGIPTGDIARSNSTLTGRQWGISPRVGFAYSPPVNHGTVVVRGGLGLYYDRGELFSYLSQPAGGATGGPFGVTESAPLVSYTTASGKKNTLASPLATNGSASGLPNANPANMVTVLQNQLNIMTASTASYGLNCGGVGQQEEETCTVPANFAGYNKANVLPYTINFNFDVQWQPRNDLALTIGYVGNVGRHSVIPIPINEAQIATTTSPAMILGQSPHSGGETDSYGFEVLNATKYADKYDDYTPIQSEPWDTYDGGNVDVRVPYVGYNPNSTLYSTVGASAYDALQTHVEKRMSHDFQVGGSYTWSHALDEQSDIGLFFTGENPNDLQNSWAKADFDRTNVFSANFQVLVPNTAKAHSMLSYFTNDWSLTGIGIAQSGEPFSLYEYYGAVGSDYVGNYPSLMNPVLPVANPANVRKQLTGNSGKFRGVGGSYIPSIDPSQIAINYLQPGQKGVPTASMGGPTDPVDIYETDFAPGNQRNIFRQAAQKRLDLSFRKSFKPTEKLTIEYAFNVFNVFNTTSPDIPQDQAHIRQENYTCSNTALSVSGSNCAEGFTYYQIVTSNSPGDQQSALANLDQKPIVSGSGKSLTIPTTIGVGTGPCTISGVVSSAGCVNNDANIGSVTGTIGGARAFTMGLHIIY